MLTIRALPAQNSTDWYGHYSDIDASVREQNVTTRAVLASDVVNSNATANTIADVTGLSIAVDSGVTYHFRAVITYASAATSNGSRWSMNGPTFSNLAYMSMYSLAATTQTINSGMNAWNLPTASNASSIYAGNGNLAVVEGIVTTSAAGTLQVRFASESASTAITAKAGSVLILTKLS